MCYGISCIFKIFLKIDQVFERYLNMFFMEIVNKCEYELNFVLQKICIFMRNTIDYIDMKRVSL